MSVFTSYGTVKTQFEELYDVRAADVDVQDKYILYPVTLKADIIEQINTFSVKSQSVTISLAPARFKCTSLAINISI